MVSEHVGTLFAEGMQRVCREYTKHVRRSLRGRSVKLVSHPLLVRYELVQGSFEIHFQVGMSSLNDHIRRISSAYVCVLEILQNVVDTF